MIPKFTSTTKRIQVGNGQYVGMLFIFTEDRHVCVKPLRIRLEAIQKLKCPVTPKGCKSFAGMVNFVNMFGPEL